MTSLPSEVPASGKASSPRDSKKKRPRRTSTIAMSSTLDDTIVRSRAASVCPEGPPPARPDLPKFHVAINSAQLSSTNADVEASPRESSSRQSLMQKFNPVKSISRRKLRKGSEAQITPADSILSDDSILSSKKSKMSLLKSHHELMKHIDLAKANLEKLQHLEAEAIKRVQALEKREQELLKSCEKLEETSLTQLQSSQKKNKKKLKTESVPTPELENYLLAIDTRDVQICETLGKGASGASVYLVSIDGWCCAMKELPRNDYHNGDSESIEKEMALLYQIPKHPNIARYLYHRKLRGRYCLFMSRYSGTLRQEINKRQTTSDYFALQFVIKMATEIVNGLNFLHSLNIIHRDIKVCLFIFIPIPLQKQTHLNSC
jgi:hypothetical protein